MPSLPGSGAAAHGAATSSIWDMAAHHAAQSPSATAVRGDRNYTYQEIVARAEDLAKALATRAHPGELLALDIRSPLPAVVAILAAGRLQCAVLPLNADSPQRYREFVLADAGPALVLHENGSGAVGIQEVQDAGERRALGPDAERLMQAAAYVMYTSGSTGRPKGVVVSQQALLARLAGLAIRPGFSDSDSIMAMTALSFDISMAELLLPLYVGGSFVAAPPGARLDPATFDQAVRQSHPTVVQATPSFWRLALAWGWTGSSAIRIWCGGEALTPQLAKSLLPCCAQLWNVYGPTEATIWASAARVNRHDRLDLGRPLPGSGLFLRSPDGTHVAVPGESGEIVLFGAGLANGYINRPDLTADRFCDMAVPDGETEVCYRTGDLASFRHDGTLDFQGRIDSQIKLRGHRIELGEIESVAEEHPTLREAVALVGDAENAARAHIALFAVTEGDVEERDVRRWLSERLPPAMRPGKLYLRGALPRTTAGKIDRVALRKELG